jgi:hypothetical protein
MKKALFGLTIIVLLFVLVACSKTSNASGASGNSAALSSQAELLIGTFKLENTDLAVSSDQAAKLLPLWQTLQSLTTSNTAATEEINSVVDQIKSTMTAAQMDKITAMKLTQQDMLSIMSQSGVPINGASTTATPMVLNGLPSLNGAQGGPGGNGAPAGGPPAGGAGEPMPGGNDFAGGGPGTNGVAGGTSSTPQVGRMPGMENQVPPPLLNALIELLQKKNQ